MITVLGAHALLINHKDDINIERGDTKDSFLSLAPMADDKRISAIPTFSIV